MIIVMIMTMIRHILEEEGADMGNDSGNITVNADELCNTYVVGCDNGAGGTYSLADCQEKCPRFPQSPVMPPPANRLSLIWRNAV